MINEAAEEKCINVLIQWLKITDADTDIYLNWAYFCLSDKVADITNPILNADEEIAVSGILQSQQANLTWLGPA